MNFEDSATNKVYRLCLPELLARDIFMSQPVSGLFPYRENRKLGYLSCFVFLIFLLPAHRAVCTDAVCYEREWKQTGANSHFAQLGNLKPQPFLNEALSQEKADRTRDLKGSLNVTCFLSPI